MKRVGRGTALLYSPVFREHLTAPGHPESPARLDALLKGLDAAGLRTQLHPLPLHPASLQTVALCHSRAYIHLAEEEILRGQHQLSTGDTLVCEASFEAARYAAGAAVAAVDAVVAGPVYNAFCALRPPGHHASPSRGMGFCVFNNAAIAARYAQTQYGLARVLIVDWDVHHGNGTQDIFYEDPSVFFFSVHQHPWYPGTGLAADRGAGPGTDSTLNVPLDAGAGRAEVLAAFDEQLLPAMERFRPELVVVSAGFDSRQNDPLGLLTLDDADFADLTRRVTALAERWADGRVVSVLEGGYDPVGLPRAAAAHVAALLEAAPR